VRIRARNQRKQELVADTPFQAAGREGKDEKTISVFELLTDSARGPVASLQDYLRMLCGRSIANIFVGPHYLQDTLIQDGFIGAGSMPIILLAGFLSGGDGAANGSQFTRFGQSF